MKKWSLLTGMTLALLVSCHAKKKSDSQLDAVNPTIKLGAGALPPTLNETGLFANGDIQAPSPGLQPYEVRVPLWSDGALKDRFVFTPRDKAISFNGTKMDVPLGSVFVKHFRSDNDPGLHIETRVIVLNEDGSWTYGTYLWNEDGSTELLERSRTVSRAGKEYRIPSPKECTSCHRSNAEVLGFTAEQLNQKDQIQRLADLKVLNPDVASMLTVKPLEDIQDPALSMMDRARTYMHVNCSVCHNPEGPPGANLMDMRLEAQDTHLLSLGKIIPGKPEDSILFQRISAETSRMPPVSIRADPLAVDIFRKYIEGLLELPKPPDGDEARDVPPTPEDRVNPDPQDGTQQSLAKVPRRST